jgi:hypothetical protein
VPLPVDVHLWPACHCGDAAVEHYLSWLPGGAILVEECEADGCECESYRFGEHK